jgi:hypothetical protein
MNMSDYDVIYKERVYKAVDMNVCFDKPPEGEKSIQKPKFLDVICIDQSGEIIAIHDETFMFRFIRKGRDTA